MIAQAYDALNFLGSVPWRINKNALKVVSAAWERGGEMAGLIPREMAPFSPRSKTALMMRPQPFNLMTTVGNVSTTIFLLAHISSCGIASPLSLITMVGKASIFIFRLDPCYIAQRSCNSAQSMCARI